MMRLIKFAAQSSILLCLLLGTAANAYTNYYALSIATEKTSGVMDFKLKFTCMLIERMTTNNTRTFTISQPVVDIWQDLKDKGLANDKNTEMKPYIHGKRGDKILEEISDKVIQYKRSGETWRLVSDETKKNHLLGPLSSVTSYCIVHRNYTGDKRLFGRGLKTLDTVELDKYGDETLGLNVLGPQTGKIINNYEITVLSDSTKPPVLLSRVIMSDDETKEMPFKETFEMLLEARNLEDNKEWKKLSDPNKIDLKDADIKGKQLYKPKWSDKVKGL